MATPALKHKDRFKLTFQVPQNDRLERYLFIYSRYEDGLMAMADLTRMKACNDKECGPFTMDDAASDVLYFVAAEKVDPQLALDSLGDLPAGERQVARNQLLSRLDNDGDPWIKRVVLR